MSELVSSQAGAVDSPALPDYSPDYEVLFARTDMMTREEWLEARRPYIGGSEIAMAMGCSPFGGPYSLWVEKVEGIEAGTESEYMKWGNRLEAPIATAFWEETGLTTWHQPVMLRSKRCSFAAANPDRFCQDEDGLAIVEVKAVGAHRSHEWDDGPPLHYRLQGQWYLLVSGLKRVYFAVLIGGQNFVIYKVERDDELIAEMVRQAEAFWSLVTLKRAPEVDGSDATTDALRAQYDTVERPAVDGGKALAVLVTSRASAKAVADTAATQLQEIDNKIVALLGDAEAGTVDGLTVVTRKSSATTRLDISALRRDYPELARDYSVTSQSRKFHFPRVKEAK